MAANEKPQTPSGLIGVLDRIAKGLDGQPALQAAIGGAILIVVLAGAVGGVAADQLWLFVVALVVLVLAGLGAWLVKGRRDAMTNGSTFKVGRDAKVGGRAEVLHDRGTAPGGVHFKIGRDFTASDDAKVGGGGGGSDSSARDAQPETPSGRDAGS
jgi:hypothetical protein